MFGVPLSAFMERRGINRPTVGDIVPPEWVEAVGEKPAKPQYVLSFRTDLHRVRFHILKGVTVYYGGASGDRLAWFRYYQDAARFLALCESQVDWDLLFRAHYHAWHAGMDARHEWHLRLMAAREAAKAAAVHVEYEPCPFPLAESSP